MFSNFNAGFKSTIDQQINRQQMLLDYFEDNIGKCSTCVYAKNCNSFNDNYCCMKENPLFWKIIRNETNTLCDSYKRDDIKYDEYIFILQLLKEQKEKIISLQK